MQRLFPHDQIDSIKRTQELVQKETLCSFVEGILIQTFMEVNVNIAFLRINLQKKRDGLFKTFASMRFTQQEFGRF